MSSINLNDVANYRNGQLTGHAIATMAWHRLDDWIQKWRNEHPEDDRDDFELIDEYWRDCRNTQN